MMMLQLNVGHSICARRYVVDKDLIQFAVNDRSNSTL